MVGVRLEEMTHRSVRAVPNTPRQAVRIGHSKPGFFRDFHFINH
jgi:hypothetical protein